MAQPTVTSPAHPLLESVTILDPDQQHLVEKISSQLSEINKEIQAQEAYSQTLSKEIEVASADRIRHLPNEIQREHDAVASEIADLNWHLSRAKRKLHQVNSKRDRCEMLHKRLSDSIANVDKHAPMVEDKLVLEQKEMEDIEKKQVGADKAYNRVKKELDDIESGFNQRIKVLDGKRVAFEEELQYHKDDLDKLINILNEKKNDYTSYMNNIEMLENQVVDYEEESKTLYDDTQRAIIEEKNLNEIIVKLKDVIRRLDEENVDMVSEKEFLNDKTAEEHERSKEKLDRFKNDTKQTTQHLLEVQDKIKVLQMDIEDAKEETKICHNHVEQSHRETDRLVAEKERTEKELSNSQREQVSLNSKMALIQLQLEQETKKIYGVETKLKGKVDNLRRTQQNNILEKFKLEEKIERATADLHKMQKDNDRKKKNAMEKVAATEKLANQTKKNLDQVKNKLLEIEQERVHLKEELNEYTHNTEISVGKLISEEQCLESDYNEINSKVLQLKNKIANIKNHSAKLTTEKKDMQIQCKAMKTKIANGEESLKTLHILMQKKKGEVARERALNDELERQVCATEERIEKRTLRNSELLSSRSSYLRTVMKKLRDELDRNESLAAIYKQIQAYNLAAKSAVLSINEKRSQIELSVDEQSKIIKLQNKTNERLEAVLEKQKIANQARVDYLKFTQNLNSSALGVIKNDLLKSTKDVDQFIKRHNVPVYKSDHVEGRRQRSGLSSGRSRDRPKGSKLDKPILDGIPKAKTVVI